MAQQVELQISPREVTGKATKRLRKAGIIPANIFGHKQESQTVQVEALAFEALRRTHRTKGVLSLRLPGRGNVQTALIRHIQRDPRTGKILHIDFFRVSLTERITVKVPLHVVGEAPVVGGLPALTHGLVADFADRGHQVWVVAPSYGASDVNRIEHKVRVHRFSSLEWPTYGDLRIPFLPILPFRKLLKKADPDIIHIHSPVVLGNIAQIVAGGLRKPIIATNHFLPINMSRSLSSDPIIGKPFMYISYSYLVTFCNHSE